MPIRGKEQAIVIPVDWNHKHRIVILENLCVAISAMNIPVKNTNLFDMLILFLSSPRGNSYIIKEAEA